VSHELEELADGSTAFVSAREPAWHHLGTVADGPMTAAEMLKLSKLGGWNVRKSIGVAAVIPSGQCSECRRKVGAKHTQKCPVPGDQDRDSTDLVVTEEDTATLTEVPGWYSTIRDVPVSGEVQPLGVVGPEYTPVQNEELAEFLTSITDQSGAVFETAGSLRGGQDVFMTLKLPESIKVGGSDEVELYLAGLNSHTGRRKLQVITTPVRVVCANTERAALANTESRYTFRHSSGIQGRLAEAREALKITFTWAEAFQAEAEAMINTQMSNDQFGDLVKAVFPEKFGKPLDDWRKPDQEQWESLQALFRSADTQENIRGTVWAGYQSLVEYWDWQVPVQGKDDRAEIDIARAFRSFDGAYDPLKIKTFDLCRDIVAAA
jgi:phage/plasmid-like protein (TIGR03299 family)